MAHTTGGEESRHSTLDFSLEVDDMELSLADTVEKRLTSGLGGPVQCPGCRSRVAQGTSVCGHCGFLLGAESTKPEAPNLCVNPQCGAGNQPGAERCVRCNFYTSGVLRHGRYRFERFLKEGGFGSVYRGVDAAQANRPVAIKDMINGNNPFEQCLKFFQRERDILKALQQVPIVPRVYDFIHEGPIVRLVMEFIDGENLLDVLVRENHKPFPIPLVIEWGKVICDLLDTMHRQSPPLIHRDLKPDNVMLLKDGRSIKMIDFGAARTFEDPDSTKTGLYSEGYAPLEQVLYRKPEPRSDLYALAATLYCLASGRTPENLGVQADVEKQLADSTAIPAEQRWFFELLRRNLSQDVNARHPTAKHLKAALEAQGSLLSASRLGSLEAAANAPVRNWDEINDLSRDVPLTDAGFPARLRQVCEEARRRVAGRERLVAALQAGAARPIVDAFDPAVFKDWPAMAHLVEQVQRAREQLQAIAELQSALANVGDGRAFVSLWARHQSKLGNVPDAAVMRQYAEQWQQRLAASERLSRLVKQVPAPPERAIAEAWDELERCGGLADATAHRERAMQARQRVVVIDKLRAVPLVDGEISDRILTQAWDEALLKGCAEAVPYASRYQAARGRLQVLDQLQLLIEQVDRGLADESDIVRKAAQLPDGYVHRFEGRVKAARQRCVLEREFEAAVTNPNEPERAIAEAWDKAIAAGVSLARIDKYRPRVELARARANLLDKLRAIPPIENETTDSAFHHAWDESLFKGCAEALVLRIRQQSAQRRLSALGELQRTIEQVDRGMLGDDQIIAKAAALPPGYEHQFLARVQAAYLIVARTDDLQRAMRATPQSDRSIADAWDQAVAAGANNLDQATLDRCRLAVQRRDCLRELESIGPALDAERQDRRWLAAWDQALLENCRDAEPLRRRHQFAGQRLAAWKVVEDVLNRKDVPRMRASAANPLLAAYLADNPRSPEIESLLRQADKYEAVIDLMKQGKPAAFGTGVDIDHIRRNLDLFQNERDRIEAMLLTWLTRDIALSKEAPQFDSYNNQLLLRWRCPQFARLTMFQLAKDPRRFFATPEDASGNTSNISPPEYQRVGGIAHSYQMRGSQLYVTVWPVIRLWKELRGKPLEIGPITVPARRPA